MYMTQEKQNYLLIDQDITSVFEVEQEREQDKQELEQEFTYLFNRYGFVF
jgi:hypothetical protein